MSALDIASQLIQEGDLSLLQRLLWFGDSDEDETKILNYLNSKLWIAYAKNIQELIDRFNRRYKNDPGLCLILFSRLGSMNWVHYFINNGATHYNVVAVVGVQPDLSWINLAMAYAAKEGHIEIVQLMLSLGVTDYDKAMEYASEEGHIEIVQLMLSQGATNYNKAMESAVRHMNIVQLMLSLGATNYDDTMIAAASRGQIEIVQLMLSLGATNYDSPMIHAASQGHIEIVRLMLDLGATRYNCAIDQALKNGHGEIVLLLMSRTGRISKLTQWLDSYIFKQTLDLD